MRRTAALFILCLVSVSGAFAQESKRDEYDFSGYNVIMISFDALGASHVGCMGYPRNTTPVIDEYAKKGFAFTQTVAQAGWTVPSHMSMFTSLYPSEHRMVNKYSVYSADGTQLSNLDEVRPGTATLAQVLKENGYATGGFNGDAGVGGKFGFAKGFDVYDDGAKFSGFDSSIPRALAWLQKNKGKKFFLFLHGYDCHGQFDPPNGYTRRFVDFVYSGPLRGGKEEQGRLREEGLERGSIDLKADDVWFWRALYDEKISDASARISAFLDSVAKMGLAEKTIVVFIGDHGTEFYEHRRFDHGFSLYDELIHIPLVIYLPGLPGGTVVKDQVREIDLMPTLLALLKASYPEKTAKQMRGVSLVPLMKGGHADLPAFSETDYRLYVHKRSLRSADGWKFIYSLDTDKKELYDLKSDPGETKDLAERNPIKCYEMEQELLRWLFSMKVDLRELSRPEKLRIKEY